MAEHRSSLTDEQRTERWHRLNQEIFNQVKENHNKLNNCEYHEFSIDLNPEKVFSKKYQCINCLGTVDSHTKNWYEIGMNHLIKKEETK